MLVGFVCQAAGIRIVAVGGQGGICNHGGFEVEPSVAQVKQQVRDRLFSALGIELALGDGHGGRCAAKDFTLGEGCDLRHNGSVAFALQQRDYAVDGCVELNGADEGDGLSSGEVLSYGVDEVASVDANGDEDVQSGHVGDGDGYQAAVRIVDKQVATEGAGGEVVDAACAVGHVAHDQGGGAGAEAREDVGDGGGEEEQALGKLQGDGGGARGADAMDAFVDLEVVVRRQEGDGGVDVGVVEDRVGDRVQGAGGAARLGHCELRLAGEKAGAAGVPGLSHTLDRRRVLDAGGCICHAAHRLLPAHEPPPGLLRRRRRSLFRHALLSGRPQVCLRAVVLHLADVSSGLVLSCRVGSRGVGHHLCTLRRGTFSVHATDPHQPHHARHARPDIGTVTLTRLCLLDTRLIKSTILLMLHTTLLYSDEIPCRKRHAGNMHK